MRQNESGNMLWLILIAIILLGSLSVMISRSCNTSNETGDYERQTIHATKIMRYTKGIETGVQNLLARGCGENDISFENSVVAGYSNPGAPPDESCHVFSTAGAGMTYREPDSEWLDNNTGNTSYGKYYFTSSVNIEDVQTNAADSGAELIMVLPLINSSLCTAINRQLGVNATPVDNGIIDNGFYDARKFSGGFTSNNGLGDDAGLSNNDVIHGKQSLCIQSDNAFPAAGTYHFYHVLIAR